MSLEFASINDFLPFVRPFRGFPAQLAQTRSTPRSCAEIFSKVSNPEFLLKTFRRLKRRGGPAPGPDGIRLTDLSITEAAAALRKVAGAIRDGRYRPYPTRAVRIAKANGGHRVLQIGTVCDRVVAAAVYRQLAAKVDAQLMPGVYGFRPGRSVLQLLAAMERTMIDQNRYVIVTDDIANAFPSVPIATALAVLQPVIDDPRLLRLIEALLRGADGQLRMVGIDQGSAISPMVLNLVLNVCLDRPFSAGPGNPPWYRWADDLTYLCRGATEGRLAIQHATDQLAVAGFRLKGSEVSPNLRRQGAKMQILGYDVTWEDEQLRLHVPGKAWTWLKRALGQTQEAADPCVGAKGIVLGWLAVYGCAFGGAEVARYVDRVVGIAAGLGFRELGDASHLVERACRSQSNWDGIRARGCQGEPGC